VLVYIILSVFIAGLMVGRTKSAEDSGLRGPDGDADGADLSLVILTFTAISSVSPGLARGHFQPGPHGLSEMLYAYSSGAANNGSAFGGLGPTPGDTQHARPRDVVRPVLHDHPAAGHRRQPEPQEADSRIAQAFP
jgi:hypothetical protein